MRKLLMVLSVLLLFVAFPLEGGAFDEWDLRFQASGKPLYVGETSHRLSLWEKRLPYVLEQMNYDRIQTYEIAARGAERNPILGPRPSRAKIEALIGITEIGLYLLGKNSLWLEQKLPLGRKFSVSHWLPVLVYDSVRYTEMLVVQHNEAVDFARKHRLQLHSKWPPALALGYTFQF